MRVLWFSINPSCYVEKFKGDIGRSWIASLEKIVKQNKDIQLGVAFEYNSNQFKETIDDTDYYPIAVCENRFDRLSKEFTIEIEERKIIPECIKIVNDFKPDIIQCFGSEWCYALIAEFVNIPVVIHMQGSMPSYYNALYPPGYSGIKRFLFEASRLNLKNLVRSLFEKKKASQRMEREFRILQLNKYFLGRTDWDKSIVKLLSHDSKYHVCNEALRDEFYETNETWEVKNSDTVTLCTTGSGSLWKGLDVILKTAYILKNRTSFKFRWKIIGGIVNKDYIEFMESKRFAEHNIEFTGVLGAAQLRRELLNSNLYVHPAYIDNSPNALCEAMILGLPCIASFVGGVPSLISDGVNGLLVPVNEPYYLARKIIELAFNEELQTTISTNARLSAMDLHSNERINAELTSAYRQILIDYRKRNISI